MGIGDGGVHPIIKAFQGRGMKKLAIFQRGNDEIATESAPFASVLPPRRGSGFGGLLEKFREEAGRAASGARFRTRTAVSARKPSARRFPPAISGAPVNRTTAKAGNAGRGQLALAAGAAYTVDDLQRLGEGPLDEDGELVREVTHGRHSVYRRGKGKKKDAFHTTILASTEHPLTELRTRATNYLLPDGYPHTVSAEYTPYMKWRGVQYFFGGAMSVFTTRSLLASLGVGRPTETAAAINWVLKDGAGRMGKFMFARFGKKLDCETKQFRLAGDVLMEVGAGMELSTILAPQFFLPLAAAANLAKNVAAASASSTRAPIYRQFALNNNLGDVTAKGESVGNLADMCGTLVGIMLSRANPPLVLTFACLSTGYLTGSFNEVSVVRLPYLNRARLGVAVRVFLEEGRVPGVGEANRQEPLLVLPGALPMPWAKERPVKIGVSVAEACETARDFNVASRLFERERYMVCYRAKARQAYVLLKEGAGSADMLRGAFQAHLVMHLLEEGAAAGAKKEGGVSGAAAGGGEEGGARAGLRKMRERQRRPSPIDVDRALLESCRTVDRSYDSFIRQANQQGWVTNDTLLNPGESRIVAA